MCAYRYWMNYDDTMTKMISNVYVIYVDVINRALFYLPFYARKTMGLFFIIFRAGGRHAGWDSNWYITNGKSKTTQHTVQYVVRTG